MTRHIYYVIVAGLCFLGASLNADTPNQSTSCATVQVQLKNATAQIASLQAQLKKVQTGPNANVGIRLVQLGKDNIQLQRKIDALENQLNLTPQSAVLTELRNQLVALKNQYTIAQKTIETLRAAFQTSQQTIRDKMQESNKLTTGLNALKSSVSKYIAAEKNLSTVYNYYKDHTHSSADFPISMVAKSADELEKGWTGYQEAISALNTSLRLIGMPDSQLVVNSTLATVIEGVLASASAFK